MAKNRTFIVAAALAVALAGCGKSSDETESPAPDTATVAEAAPATGPALGEKLFLQCRACHTVGASDPDGVGPNLHNAFDAAAGSRPKYAYSSALKSSGLVWTRENLDAFLTHPTAKVPGTKMAFAGVADAKQRAALIDYMATLKDAK